MESLSPKQLKVCELVAQGLSSKQIAVKMGISPRTVDAHREEIYRKVGVRNAIELVRKVFEGKASQ